MESRPQLSVVMPVRNGLPFLDESIGSIVNQTFTDFEFVILDDASTDGSEKILREWERRDHRIRVFQSDRSLGLAASSNAIVAKATTPVVARMDADDISHRDRLRRQWEILNDQPDVVVVGSLCDGIDVRGRRVRPRDRWRLVRYCRYIPFPHGSAMFRRAAFDAVNGYREEFTAGEDQDFFLRMTAHGRVVTLPDVLYHFRYHLANSTLLTGASGARAVNDKQQWNGQDLAGLYMLGAMRLWAGQPPDILREIVANKSFGWNQESLIALASASVGKVSPGCLRFLLRSFIRTRDCLAGLQVKDGRAYEWRLK